jgi:ubiquitin-protein ligase
MHAFQNIRRINREIGDIDSWRFAEMREITLVHYTNYMSNGIHKKRRKYETKTLYNYPLFDVIRNSDENIRVWKAFINYPGQCKRIDLEIGFSKLYPFEPPTIRIISYTTFECVDANGFIDTSALFEWSPTYTIGAILLVLTSMLFPKWAEQNDQFRQTERTRIYQSELREKIDCKNFTEIGLLF